MRRNWLIICILITGYIFFILSGCDEQNQNEQNQMDNGSKQISEPIQVQNPDLNTTTQTNNLKPEIKFETTDVNFGEVGPGSVSMAELKFENIGEGTLIIEEITQCCGIHATTDKDLYEPGESGVFKIEYHDKGQIGHVLREPVIHCNDPNNKQITFSVEAECIQIVVWEPEKIKLYLNEENAACPKLTIKSLDEQPFSIKSIKSTGDCITADYDYLVKQNEYVLDLKVDMEKLTENTAGEITIDMTHPQGQIATVNFNVVPKYGISPKQLILFNLSENKQKHEKITILNNYDEKLEIKSTSSKENHIKMLDYKETGGGFEMNIEITPVKTDGELRFEDIFSITFENGDQLDLPCWGYFE